MNIENFQFNQGRFHFNEIYRVVVKKGEGGFWFEDKYAWREPRLSELEGLASLGEGNRRGPA